MAIIDTITLAQSFAYAIDLALGDLKTSESFYDVTRLNTPIVEQFYCDFLRIHCNYLANGLTMKFYTHIHTSKYYTY